MYRSCTMLVAILLTYVIVGSANAWHWDWDETQSYGVLYVEGSNRQGVGVFAGTDTTILHVGEFGYSTASATLDINDTELNLSITAGAVGEYVSYGFMFPMVFLHPDTGDQEEPAANIDVSLSSNGSSLPSQGNYILCELKVNLDQYNYDNMLGEHELELPLGIFDSYSLMIQFRAEGLSPGSVETRSIDVKIRICDPETAGCRRPCGTGTPECPKPVVLLLAGAGADQWATGIVNEAQWRYYQLGWYPQPVQPTPEALLTALANPCVRGLLVVAHGHKDHRSVIYLNGGPHGVQWITAEDIGLVFGPNRRMDFIAPLACNQFEEDWRTAFSDLGEVVLPVKPHGPRRYISWGNQYWEAMERGHAVDVPACPDKKEMLGINPVTCGRGVGEECSTFALCDSTGCGHDLFPAIACIQNRDLPAGGVISAVAPDGSFFIEAQYLPSHSDTAVVYGTSFEIIPEDLLADTMVPISRHLVAYAVTSDPYAEPELLNVMIAYEEADLESAGVQDEQSLRVYWDTGLTEGQFIASVVDTHLNEVSFTISSGGIGGIYGEGTSPAPQASIGGYILYAASPNPFNPQTTISFVLPSEMAVSLRVYDVAGRLVDVLVDGEVAQQGRNEVVWQGRDSRGRQLPSGTYFYRLEAGGYSETKRMTLLK